MSWILDLSILLSIICDEKRHFEEKLKKASSKNMKKMDMRWVMKPLSGPVQHFCRLVVFC